MLMALLCRSTALEVRRKLGIYQHRRQSHVLKSHVKKRKWLPISGLQGNVFLEGEEVECRAIQEQGEAEQLAYLEYQLNHK